MASTIDQKLRRAEDALRSLYGPIVGTPDYAKAIEAFREATARLRADETATVDEIERLLSTSGFPSSSRAQLSTSVLASIGGSRAAEALVKVALGEDILIQSLGVTGLRLLERTPEVFEYLSVQFGKAATPGESLRREGLVAGLARQLCREKCEHFAQLTLSHSSAFVRTVAVRALAQIGGNETVPHLRAALQDAEISVRLWALFGLVFEGDTDRLAELNQYANKPGRARAEAVSLLGLIPLPAVVESVLGATDENATKAVRLAAVLRAGGLGVRDSLSYLSNALEHKDTAIVEQAAAALRDLLGHDPEYVWKGRRLTGESVKAIKELCQSRYAEWDPGHRYLHGKLMTAGDLISALRSLNSTDSTSLFWTLVGMANERFEYDPSADLVANWDSVTRWTQWVESAGTTLQAGAWYFAGKAIDFHLEP